MRQSISVSAKLLLLLTLTFCFPGKETYAAPVKQTITLHRGWNAVFLEVQPQSTDPSFVFSEDTFTPAEAVDDLESVWKWNPQLSTVEFIENPGTPVQDNLNWSVYYPDSSIHGNSMLITLHAINGGTAYMIHLEGSGGDVEWTVTGEPTIPRIDWKSNSYNLVGFHLDDENPPLFNDFFSSSQAHSDPDHPPYILKDTGGNREWKQVTGPSERMQRGEAVWVYCSGYSEFTGSQSGNQTDLHTSKGELFTGPLSVLLDQGEGLHYGKMLDELNLTVKNNSDATISNIAIQEVNSGFPGSSELLYYWTFDGENNIAGWQLLSTISPLTIDSGESQKLRIGVKRIGLEADTEYAANLQISDESNNILVPVSVEGISYSGLWFGNATITKVSQPSNYSDPDTPVKAASPFSFRMIIHVTPAAEGTEAKPEIRLLSQVIQMWQEGTWKPDPNDMGRQIVDQPGHFVLLTNDDLIPQYSGSAMRDGQLVGRRISAQNFPNLITNEQMLMGEKEDSDGRDLNPFGTKPLCLTITLQKDDPTNPFRHMFHPDHKESEQSYKILRDITLTFSDKDSEGKLITGVPTLSWGSSELGGVYTEEITGLHRNHLFIEGIFQLHKVSDVEELNPDKGD